MARAEGRRAEILARWLAALDGQGGAAGGAPVYAAYATEVQNAAPADRATVAHALGRLGLHRAAVRVLAAGADGAREPAVAVTLAEETFASGDIGSARKLLVRLDPSRLRPDLAERAHALGARVALAGGDLERADPGGDGAARYARRPRRGERAPPAGAGAAGEHAARRGGGRGGGGGVGRGRGRLHAGARGGRDAARAHAGRGRAGPHRARPRRAGAGRRGAGRAARDGRRARAPG